MLELATFQHKLKCFEWIIQKTIILFSYMGGVYRLVLTFLLYVECMREYKLQKYLLLESK